MSKASPEQQSTAHCLDIPEDGSTCGRQTADGLKERIKKVRYLAGDNKRQTSQYGQEYPGECDDYKALLGIDHLVTGLHEH